LLRQPKHICGIILVLTALFFWLDRLSGAESDLDPQRILKQLVPEVSEVKLVAPEELEPNPKGEYRRNAFVRRDFNRDGIADIAICGVDAWVQQGASRRRNGYVLIASKNPKSEWTRVFFHKFPQIAYPFLIWDQSRMALLVGANQSDSNLGDIVWDREKKAYKLVTSVQK
jgi:hypothetical protein